MDDTKPSPTTPPLTPTVPTPKPTQKDKFIATITETPDDQFERELAMGTKMADDVARLGPGARPVALSLDEMALLLEHRIAMVRDGGDADCAAYLDYAARLGDDLLSQVVERMDRPRVAGLTVVEVALLKHNLRSMFNRRQSL